MKKLNHGYQISGNKICKSRPYDDASYYYAFQDLCKETWSVYKDGIKIKDIEDFDDLNDIADELEMVNSAIKAVMIHN